jgi:hypothetical protein
MCNTASACVDTGLSALSQSEQRKLAHCEQHAQSTAAILASSSSDFSSEMQVVTAQGIDADRTLATVSGMVGAKRKFLDSTVTELCEHVDNAIEEGVKVVDATSEMATKVLSDVSNASQAMDASSGAALASFTAFMDK